MQRVKGSGVSNVGTSSLKLVTNKGHCDQLLFLTIILGTTFVFIKDPLCQDLQGLLIIFLTFCKKSSIRIGSIVL